MGRWHHTQRRVHDACSQLSATVNFRPQCPRDSRQRGVVTIEFALLAIVFFTVIFGIIEIGRYIFLRTTLQQVTRQAAHDASVADYTDTAWLDTIRQRAIFRTAPGPLVLSGNIDDTNVRIDYLSFSGDAITPPPVCPSTNASNCLDDPHSASCIRFVRVRVCAAGPDCLGVPYVPMVGLLSPIFPTGVNALRLPLATTVTPIEPMRNFSPETPGCP